MISRVATSLAVVLGLGVLLLACGYSPLAALEALLRGAFGSAAGLEATARRAGPLLFAGLGVALAFRAGLWNIGAEGQLVAGAVAASWVALRVAPGAGPVLAPVLGMAAAAACGAAWASIAAALRVGRGVPEVISTILLNFVALELLSYVVQGPLRESAGGYPQTDRLPAAFSLHALVPGSQVHAGLLVGLLLALGLSLVLFHTAFGLELRVLGAAPGVAAHAGVPTRRRVLAAFALSGALAGLGGGIELMGVTHRLFERFAPGTGFTAIAVALLGRLHPLGVVPAAIFFGALEAGAGELQRSAGVPSVVVAVLQGAALLLALSWLRRME